MDEEKKHLKLESIPKREPFTTPNNYFDELPERIQKKIDNREAKTVKLHIPPHWHFIAAAACIALLVIALPLFTHNADPTISAKQLLAEVSEEDCALYLQSMEGGTEEIMDVILEEDLGMLKEEDFEYNEVPIEDGDLDILYEKYGVSTDEELNKL